jgi:DNA polymerase I-like protein with 3'-5' exonuclease and polymerase domains
MTDLPSQYQLVTDDRTAQKVIRAIAESGQVHALDFETTGLRPADADVRLTCICGPTGGFVFDHVQCAPFSDYALALAEACPWAVFNAGFEGRWFDYATQGPDVRLFDVGVMSKAKLGGRPLSLADMAKRDLKKQRDNKHLQLSDWSASVLTQEQYDYGFEDADDTYALYVMWQEALSPAQWNGFRVLNDAWRGTAEMEDTGMVIDEAHHSGLVRMWEARRTVSEATLRRFTPPDIIANLRSKKQISDFLKTVLDEQSCQAWPKTDKTEQLQTDRKQLRQASFRAPYPFSRWLAAMMVFNRADKYISTYGEVLLNKQRVAGRVYGRFNIAQAVTGRYSSSNPNLQNIPRSPMVRRSFIAPPNTEMVLADYSGIELRVLAEVSNDPQLKQDVIFGDVHAESAITLFRVPAAEFKARLEAKDPRAKEMRSKAKAFSFQLTYGAGNAALALVLRCSDTEAAAFVEKWAERYPRAYALRFDMFDQMDANGLLPIKSGRTVFVHKNERSLPVASNYPIQGAAADVMYRAVTRMSQKVWELPFEARMLASIHDELLMLAQDGHGETLREIMVEEMRQAWLDIFPRSETARLSESAVGQSWAAKP